MGDVEEVHCYGLKSGVVPEYPKEDNFVMNLKIPLWNGVKKKYFKQKILPFKLKQSSIIIKIHNVYCIRASNNCSSSIHTIELRGKENTINYMLNTTPKL